MIRSMISLLLIFVFTPGCASANGTTLSASGPEAAGGVTAAAGQEGGDGNVDLPRFPSISPDGSQIVFSWRGDLWKVGAEGGQN